MRKRLGTVLLAIWLILQGLIPLFHLRFHGIGTVMAVLAVSAGVLLLFGE